MVKGKKQEYYTLDRLLSFKADYNFIVGQRANGKSYAVKHYVLSHFFEHGEKFIFVKRYGTDIKKRNIEKYFNDIDLSKFKPNKEYENCFISFRAGEIYLSRFEDGKQKYIKSIGYVVSLANQEKHKSENYSDVKSILFEEFISTSYLPDELELFVNLYSTINRGRYGVKVFFIGNTISKANPYTSGFDIFDNISKMVKGEIQTFKGDNYLIAYEFCKNVCDTEKTPEKYRYVTDGEYLFLYGLKKGVYKKSKLIAEFKHISELNNQVLIEQVRVVDGKIFFFIYPYTGKPRKKVLNELTYIYGQDFAFNYYPEKIKKLLMYKFIENTFYSDIDTKTMWEYVHVNMLYNRR